MSVISFLSDRDYPEQAFLYAVHRDPSCCVLDESEGADRITTPLNDAAALSGYSVKRPLYETAQTAVTGWRRVSNEDVGVNVLMMAFAKYYVRGQYHLFVNDFKHVKEMQTVESYLNKCTKTFIKLPKDMAVDEKYGIRANAHLFTGESPLTMTQHLMILASMASKIMTPERFVETVRPYHINIVESYYLFASITRDSRVILECRELSKPTFNYVLDRFHKECRYNGEYWFEVPPRSVWFAYLDKRWKFFSYVSRDCEALLQDLRNVTGVVVGFVHDNRLFPVRVESPTTLGNWTETVATLRSNRLNVVLRDDPIPYNAKNVHFVKRDLRGIYRLDRTSSTRLVPNVSSLGGGV